MSEQGFSPRWTSTGFVESSRFAIPSPGHPRASAPGAGAELVDPVDAARMEGFTEGYHRGFAEASAEAETAANAERGARAAIELSFRRLDEALAEDLREKLRATVQVLCEQAVLPLAIDPAGLAARVEKAVAMFVRAEDERVVCIHPDDLELVSNRLPDVLEFRPDASLERGALRIETAQGGVEDGPAQWRRAIAQALSQC